MKTLQRCLAVMAAPWMLTGPALANPICRTCAVPYVAPRKSKVVVKERVIIKRDVVNIAIPYFVNSYVSTVLPAPSVNYTINVPPPPAAPVQQVQASVATAAVVASPAIFTTPGVPVVAQPPLQAVGGAPPPQGSGDALAAALDRFNARLCTIETRLGIGADPGTGAGNGGLPGQPLAAAPDHPGLATMKTSCIQCHSQSAAADGKGFVLFGPDGKAVKLDAGSAMAVLRKVEGGHMPPQPNKKNVPPLTAQQKADVRAYVISLPR